MGHSFQLNSFFVSVRRRRTRTAKVRTALSCPCPAGQTDNGQTDTAHDFPENPDKKETRTGYGQCSPPTSGFSFVKLINTELGPGPAFSSVK